MVLTKEELIGTLQHEIDILLHLAGKIDKNKLNYKPTEKQRTTLELLQYLNIMGPQLVPVIKSGTFNPDSWSKAQADTAALDFENLIASLGKQKDMYAQQFGSWSDADFRQEIEMFGRKGTRGSFVTNMLVCGHAAYRMQLFCYLKSCGREELNTMNLWAGMDAQM